MIVAACSQKISITKATSLHSPGYPGNYPGNLNCHWVIMSPENTTIKVTVEDANFADMFDQVRLVDGDSRNDPEMGILSKNSPLANGKLILICGHTSAGMMVLLNKSE